MKKELIKLKPQVSKVLTGLRLDPEYYRILKEYAETKKVTFTHLMNKLVEYFLQENGLI